MQDFFRIFAAQISRLIGSLWALAILVLSLGISGYVFKFTEQWETHVNFILSVITLTVLIFLQKSQNHGDKATHLKLDELIRASEGARNEIAEVEDDTEKNMDKLREQNR